MSSYIESKREEIDYLCTFAGVKASLHPVHCAEDIRVAKKYLFRHIRKEAIDKIEFPTTNLMNKPLNFYGQNISYTYSREGYRFMGDNKFRFIHPHSLVDIGGGEEFAAFTSSAQGAMAIVLTFVTSIDTNIEFVRPVTSIYFDTNKVIKSLEQKDQSGGDRCLILDYSVSETSTYEALDFSAYDIIVVDATCLLTGSLLEKEVFIKLKSSGAAVFIIKSLIKTDSFGEEYAQLGSLYAFNLQYFDRFKEKRDKSAENFFHRYFGRYGGFSNLENILPFFWSEKYHHLNLKRVGRFKKNLKDIEVNVLKHGHKPFRTNVHHELFSLIKIKSTDENFALRVNKLKAKAELPVFWGTSFGLDSCLLGAFEDSNTNEANSCFRFSGLDADQHSIDGVSRFIQLLLKDFIWEQ